MIETTPLPIAEEHLIHGAVYYVKIYNSKDKKLYLAICDKNNRTWEVVKNNDYFYFKNYGFEDAIAYVKSNIDSIDIDAQEYYDKLKSKPKRKMSDILLKDLNDFYAGVSMFTRADKCFYIYDIPDNRKYFKQLFDIENLGGISFNSESIKFDANVCWIKWDKQKIHHEDSEENKDDIINDLILVYRVGKTNDAICPSARYDFTRWNLKEHIENGKVFLYDLTNQDNNDSDVNLNKSRNVFMPDLINRVIDSKIKL